MDNEPFSIRDGAPGDIAAIVRFIFQHGPNEWNYLPEDGVRENVGSIATGKTRAVLAFTAGELIGVVTYETGHRYPQYQPPGRREAEHGYLSEAVVHRAYTGQGIGTRLLHTAIERLFQQGMREVYTMRHKDNIPSRRMMEKCGMEVIDEYYDPDIRPTGSRHTVITRIIAKEDKSDAYLRQH